MDLRYVAALAALLGVMGLAACEEPAAEMAQQTALDEASENAPEARGVLVDLPPEARANPDVWPRSATPSAITDEAAEAFIDSLLAEMTLEEKVGQTIQADISAITPEDMANYPLGSILAGGNSAPGGRNWASAEDWVQLARDFRAAVDAREGARIPLIFGIDAVHGHNNVIGATIFPHNIGLGAARNPELVGRIAEVTALEVAATGADWTFGPTVAVPRDLRWGRTYEGYGEDPEIVASYAGPVTLGLQGELRAGEVLGVGRIAGSAKHFLADGGTVDGVDQGNAPISEEELIRVHNAGYPPTIDAGVLTVMASFSSWNGVKITGNHTLLDDVLRGPLGFEGFVVSDWNAHGQIPGCTNESCPEAFNAGIDMFMAPDSWRPLYYSTLEQVRSGAITMERLDEAVRRILRVKIRAGLFETERPLEGRYDLIGAPEHRAVARDAVRQSLVLLKNDGVLPVRANARVLVAGSAADNIGQQSGGWTLSWQGTGTTNADFPGATSIWGGIEEAVTAAGGTAVLSADGSYDEAPDVAIVVFGETPYAEFQGDLDHLAFADPEPLRVLRSLQEAGIPTVSVFISGRPMWTNPEINASNAFVAAWLPGSEGGGVADVLIGDDAGEARYDFTGTLSFSWPRHALQAPLNRDMDDYDPLFAYGFGLTYADDGALDVLSEESGVSGDAANPDRYFVEGRFIAPWSLLLRDEGGDSRPGLAPSGESPRGAVAMRTVDGSAQESARSLTFTGPARALAWGTAVDLTRQANGEMALLLRYRADSTPEGRVWLGVGEAEVDLTPFMAETGSWQEIKVRLSCFRDLGTSISAVEEPFSLRADGVAAISFETARLASNEGDAICPAE
ncbi:glycoside hydrolase family 3 N-terminal domain-containing protein [Glycocaulis abyssi]|uniref:Glycoside hydrolase family 3 N-terminal domain-containing protein n=1 Tax=Glycocaulis abyssi TaxID=1433403 RepID=A0ABV9N6A6_9PROT